MPVISASAEPTTSLQLEKSKEDLKLSTTTPNQKPSPPEPCFDDTVRNPYKKRSNVS